MAIRFKGFKSDDLKIAEKKQVEYNKVVASINKKTSIEIIQNYSSSSISFFCMFV